VSHFTVDLGQGIGPLRLGDPKDEVLRRLAEAGMPLEDDEDDWLYVDEMDAEIKFKSTTPPILLEIIVEDERVRLGPLPVLGERLHIIVDQLGVSDAETVWRTHEEADEKRTSDERPIMTDKNLLDRGTLWIPALGLGLGMVRGEITTIRLRQPEESPRRGYGPLTPSQRELSTRSDLPTFLLRDQPTLTTPNRWIQKVLTLALFIGMGAIVFQAIEYQGRWNAATVVQGNVIDVQPPPPEPFPDQYTIDYSDLAGKQYQVVFQRNDVYVAPQVGETVEIRFLPEAPHRPLGPARYRDAAFNKYVPYGIGLMAAYSAFQILIPLASLIFRRRQPQQV
jgi:hypothetical protein